MSAPPSTKRSCNWPRSPYHVRVHFFGVSPHRFRGLLRRSSSRRAIVHLLLEGCTRKQIALKLSRSQHTIDAHLKAMYREVGVGDRARLMLLAIKLRDCGELPPPPGIG